MFDRINLWHYLVLNYCLLGVLRLPIHYWYSIYLCFLIFHGSVFRDCAFLTICQFLLGCRLYWHAVICSSLLRTIVFLWCSLYLFLSISDFNDLGPPLLFLMILDKGWFFFFNLFEEPAFNFVKLFYFFCLFVWFLVSISFALWSSWWTKYL